MMPCAARRPGREKEDLLASVPGVGPAIARTFIAELPELGTRGRKQIAALARNLPVALWKQVAAGVIIKGAVPKAA
jgi:hypothetical protein